MMTKLIPLSHAKNPDQGYFAGWNNKSSRDYPRSTTISVILPGRFTERMCSMTIWIPMMI
ncbi:MAG: hypothetical protein R2874_08880 [Desulfobacterales bacterium]